MDKRRKKEYCTERVSNTHPTKTDNRKAPLVN